MLKFRTFYYICLSFLLIVLAGYIPVIMDWDVLGIILLLAAPALWILWIILAASSRIVESIFRVIGIWLFIDALILIVLLRISIFFPDIANSQGVELVVLGMYFPFDMVLFLLPKSMAESESYEKLVMWIGNSLISEWLNGFFIMWLTLSVISAIPSFVYGYISWHIHKKRIANR